MNYKAHYQGEIVSGRYEGLGLYVSEDKKMTYEGYFSNGLYHGDGTLTTEEGKYIGVFERGKFIDGKFEFNDGLIFEDSDWKYCSSDDARFQIEIKEGVPIEGPLKYNTPIERPPRLPFGCYDTIDGYYDPRTGNVREYNTHNEIRHPNEEEAAWIVANCRIGK